MTSLPPPPLPLPPPPLPPGGPPPPSEGLPPPPFPAGGGGGSLPPPPLMNLGGGPPPPRIPFTPTVLLTRVPPFLHTFRAAREWLFPCGGVRSVTFYPRRQEDDDGDPIDLPSDARIALLVTFSHPDGACKLLGAYKQFASRLDDRYSGLQAYMVPANKDIPLPPPLLNEEAQQQLGEKLWQNFVAAESPELHGEGGMKEVHIPLDSDKVAAAAGGNNYDADEDPLNAPAVLDAVKEFRRKLSKTQSFQKKKRMELVTKKVAELRPRIQAIVEEERKRGPPLLPPPPPPPPMVPPPDLLPLPTPGGVPPPPPHGTTENPMDLGDSGKRGRSNLPAWMTATATSEDDEVDPSSNKRVKREEQENDGTARTNFPSLPESTHSVLKDFLSNKVQEALGEKEEELITFLYTHILGGGSSTDMLEELKMVLEDEAGGFLDAVWNKVYELNS